MKDTDVAYIAGILDGEGHVMPTRFSVIVANTDKAMLDFCIRVTGLGTIYGPIHREQRKPVYRWQCNGYEAAKLILLTLPWLITKKAEAVGLLLRWHKRPSKPK